MNSEFPCPAFFNGAFFLADSDPHLREILFASIIPNSSFVPEKQSNALQRKAKC
jgi:hypothetical protein